MKPLKVILFAIVICLASQSHAMTFSESYDSDGTLVLNFDGQIVSGDTESLIAFLQDNIRRLGNRASKISPIISLNSPGGSVVEAEKIAEMIFSANQATAVVAGHQCSSACFLIFAAGHPRQASPNAFIGVHSASYQQTENIGTAAITLVMARSLGKMGVPSDIIGKLVQTSPNQIYRLTVADLRAMQVGRSISTGVASPAIAPEPVLSLPQLGRWSSGRFMLASGEIRLIDARVEPSGSAIGQVIFSGSPCGTATTFLGRVDSNSVNLTMTIGRCGLTQVSLQRAGAGWVGSYTSQFPDAGTIQMQ